MAAEEDAVFEDHAEGPGEDHLFDIASGALEVIGGVGVVHGDDLLDEDGAFVELFGDEVCGGADDFDAALEGLVVGAGADEGGEEGVMDVDELAGKAVDEVRAQDAHVFGEHDEVRAVGEDGFEEAGFVLIAGEAVVGDVMEGEVEAADQGCEGVVVADDREELGVQFGVGVADEDVRQAMVFAGGEDDDAFGFEAGQLDLGVRGEQIADLGGDAGGVDRAVELGPHEEAGGRAVDEFLVAHDIDPVAEEDAGDAVDQARAVGAFDEEDLGGWATRGHGWGGCGG